MDAPRGLRITADGRSLFVSGETTVTVGRGLDCDFIVDDPMVSRAHLGIRLTTRGWEIEDLDSRNGSFVDGRRITVLAVAEAGAAIHMGDPRGVELRALPVSADPQDPTHDGLASAHAARDRTVTPTTAVNQVEVKSESPRVVTIGRAPDNTIVLADDLLVSRHHTKITITGTTADLEDLGSSNGTFVNGRTVTNATVAFDDLISIGQHDFRLTATGIEKIEGGDIRFAATGLSVRAPKGVVLLDHVDLAIGKNGFLAIVGPSGAGKTTLLNVLTGSRPADSGTVWYDGRNLYTDYDDLRRKLGIVPQDDVLHVQLTVREALMYAAELRFPHEVSAEERHTRVDEVMAELGLAQRAELRIQSLSGGQRKRVSVALELLTKPALLFLDEPTSGLDPGFERNVMQLLRGLADGGRTIVVVTHSVASLYLCDSVLVMAPGGRPAFFGPPQAAPAFFGQDDYQGIFQLLSESDPNAWPDRFADSEEHRRFAPPVDAVIAAKPATSSPSPPKSYGALRQFSTLTRRYISLLRSDRATLFILVAQAVLAGVLQFLVLPRGALAPPAHGSLRVYSSAAAILLNPVQIATALGLANSVTVLVRERAVFRRERAVGLSIPAYLFSKVLVLSVIAIAQAAILVVLTTIREGGPTGALVLGHPFLELTAVLALTGMAAMALGLMISALASTEAMAMTILPIVLVLENLLSMGGLSPGSLDKPVLNQAQYISSTQWGFAAEAATADLNNLQGLSAVLKQVPMINAATAVRLFSKPVTAQGVRRYQHLRVIWLEDMGALLALFVAALIAAGLALARLDPTLLR